MLSGRGVAHAVMYAGRIFSSAEMPGYAPSMPAEEQHASLFVLRLAHALHASGYAAHSLEDVLKHVCDRLGLIGQFFTTPTAIMASFGPLDAQRTHLIRVQPGELNLGRLSALDAVAQRVSAGELTPQEGSARIDQILGEAPDVSLVAARPRLRHRLGGRLPVPWRRAARCRPGRRRGLAHRLCSRSRSGASRSRRTCSS